MATKDSPGVSFPSPDSRKLGLLMSEKEQQQQLDAWFEEDLQKLAMLCEHYKIPTGPEMYFVLSLTLARILFPAPRKRGAKTKWTNLNKAMLVVEIERLIESAEASLSIEAAAQQLAQQDPWISFLDKKESGSVLPDPGEPLRKVYFEFRDDKWAHVARDAYEWHQFNGTLSDWDLLVEDCLRHPHPD